MIINCSSCINGVASDGNACTVCGGDGEIDLTDAIFGRYGVPAGVHGVVWDAMLTRLSDIEDKVDDVMNKCNDIKEILDELE